MAKELTSILSCPVSVNFYTGKHFSSVIVAPGDTATIELDGQTYQLRSHKEGYNVDGLALPSISLVPESVMPKSMTA